MKTAMLLLVVLLAAMASGCRGALNQSSSGGGGTTPPSTPPPTTATPPLLQLSSNGKYLVDQKTGKPVFLTGEDAWSLANQVSNADATTYIQDRCSRGYNAIWVGAADNVYQNGAPNNYYGQAPFSGTAFTNENESFWQHIDFVVQQAGSCGITVFFAPAFVGLNASEGYLSSLQSASCTTLMAYGQFLGTRYLHTSNIVWTLGGDWDPSKLSQSQLGCLAAGIRSEDTTHLLTVEVCRSCSPVNQSSMDAWTGTPAVNLNWVYAPYASIQASCASNYARSGALPALDGEDWYEGEHSMTDLQQREQGYWSILSGCTLGRFFGNNPIWCFSSTQTVAACNSGQAWKNSLGSNGSVGWQIEGKLMRSREFWLMTPDSTNKVLTGGIGSGTSLSVAGCTSDNQTCIVYDPAGNAQPPQIAMAHFTGTVHGYWVNPTSCAVTDLSTFANSGTHTFTPADGNDWVLVLDLNSAGLSPPCTGSFQ